MARIVNIILYRTMDRFLANGHTVYVVAARERESERLGIFAKDNPHARVKLETYKKQVQ